jgi:hypothetical protein
LAKIAGCELSGTQYQKIRADKENSESRLGRIFSSNYLLWLICNVILKFLMLRVSWRCGGEASFAPFS